MNKDPTRVILREERLLNGMTRDPETGRRSDKEAVKRQKEKSYEYELE